MRITGFCMTCVQSMTESLGPQHFEPPLQVSNYSLQVQDVPFYEFTCANGHKAAFVLQQQRYETLAAIGISAISDGYFREAVSSMAASVERFHEAFVRATWHSNGITPEEASKAWKQVSSQSERQLGMFISAYVAAFAKSPKPFPNAQVTFRNAVIHKGHIPSEAEARAYAQISVDYLRPLIVEASSLPNVGWHLAAMDVHKTACVQAAEKTGEQPVTLYIPTILSDPNSAESVDDFLVRTLSHKL